MLKPLDSLSLTAYLAPAFDVVAAGQGGLPGPPFPGTVRRAGARARPLPSVLAANASPRPQTWTAAGELRPVHAMQDHDALQVEAYLPVRKRQVIMLCSLDLTFSY